MGDPKGVKEGTAQRGHMDFIWVATVYQRTVSRSMAGVCTFEGDTVVEMCGKARPLVSREEMGHPKGQWAGSQWGKQKKLERRPHCGLGVPTKQTTAGKWLLGKQSALPERGRTCPHPTWTLGKAIQAPGRPCPQEGGHTLAPHTQPWAGAAPWHRRRLLFVPVLPGWDGEAIFPLSSN